MSHHPLLRASILAVLLLAVACAQPEDSTPPTETEEPAQTEQVVNVYTARHYDSDDAVYELFNKETGIRVNIIEGDSAALLERLRREGDQSPADLFVAVDAGRLAQAESEGIFAATSSPVLEERIPAHLRHPEGLWFGLTKRARVIVYAKDRVQGDEITTYEDLADPK
ncbi:MAG: extracellular solute-binding protein, partial [Acidobacteriota bacterium]